MWDEATDRVEAAESQRATVAAFLRDARAHWEAFSIAPGYYPTLGWLDEFAQRWPGVGSEGK
jgi:hypothetical protein